MSVWTLEIIMAEETLHLDKDFVVLDEALTAHIEACDEGLFERLANNYGSFTNCKLISCFQFESDWPTWEIHPHGDEIVILLNGSATLVLEADAGNKSIVMDHPGSFAVIPVNTWHTAKISSPAKMLFITPGQDTRNRPI